MVVVLVMKTVVVVEVMIVYECADAGVQVLMKTAMMVMMLQVSAVVVVMIMLEVVVVAVLFIISSRDVCDDGS